MNIPKAVMIGSIMLLVMAGLAYGTTRISDTYVNTTGTMNASSIIEGGSLLADKYVQASDWTTIDNYPSACTGENGVQGLGDTLTCKDYIEYNTSADMVAATNGSAQWSATILEGLIGCEFVTGNTSDICSLADTDTSNTTAEIVAVTNGTAQWNADILEGLLGCEFITGNTSDICTLADTDTDTNCDTAGECSAVCYTDNFTSSGFAQGYNKTIWDIAYEYADIAYNYSTNGSLTITSNDTYQVAYDYCTNGTFQLDIGNDCPADEYAYGYFDNGTAKCRADQDTGSSGANYWIDGGDYIYANVTYGDNVMVPGYLNASDWTNVSITRSQVSDYIDTSNTTAEIIAVTNGSSQWSATLLEGLLGCSFLTGNTSDICSLVDTDTSNTTAEILAVTNGTAQWNADVFRGTIGCEFITGNTSDICAIVDTDNNDYNTTADMSLAANNSGVPYASISGHPADDDTPDDDTEVPDDITIAASGKNVTTDNAFVSDADNMGYWDGDGQDFRMYFNGTCEILAVGSTEIHICP